MKRFSIFLSVMGVICLFVCLFGFIANLDCGKVNDGLDFGWMIVICIGGVAASGLAYAGDVLDWRGY